jgi:hypothetical protein
MIYSTFGQNLAVFRDIEPCTLAIPIGIPILKNYLDSSCRADRAVRAVS